MLEEIRAQTLDLMQVVQVAVEQLLQDHQQALVPVEMEEQELLTQSLDLM
jgi:hypothetical protein